MQIYAIGSSDHAAFFRLCTGVFSATSVVLFFLFKFARFFQSQSSDGPPKPPVVVDVDVDREPLDFSSVASSPEFDLDSTEPHPYRPWKGGKFQMTMNIRKMLEQDWLLLDNKYRAEQDLRRHLLDHERLGVLQILPGSEAACEETLEYVVAFLAKRYPRQFYWSRDDPGYFCNAITGKQFKVTAPLNEHPFEIAAQLIMEDLNILIKGAGPDAEDHYLRASFTMGPAGWYLPERIGWPLYRIHGPVPLWSDKLRKSVEKFFHNLKASSPVERNNFFVQTTDVMFQQEPFSAPIDSPPTIADMRLRYERQVLRRLPRTQAVLFTVRTYMKPVTDLLDEKESLWNLRQAIEAMPPEIAEYKGSKLWGHVLMPWLDEQLVGYEPESRT